MCTGADDKGSLDALVRLLSRKNLDELVVSSLVIQTHTHMRTSTKPSTLSNVPAIAQWAGKPKPSALDTKPENWVWFVNDRYST